ncbi:MAG: hypothetical protein UU71_C0021G0001 [Parcubacteria group bacterium GW2011_GWB1_41_6]|nr:MAG: hypothetical protein UU71_C0021G0001 [Parcubacteria group bacterium GW2011_GWB1_41_6]KKS70587.1 MAG: hypothetical protein UV43_C0058G0006 [Parcubacteria group bacterium GW2011_GWF2_42_7]
MNLLQKIIVQIINPVIVILVTLALVVFIWGIVQMIYGANNEEKRTQGKKHLLWGLVGLFIMLTVRGLLAIIQNFWGSV